MVASPESLFAELQNLRKKYDAVVEYTVHLTAERDTIVQRLEETEKELTREGKHHQSLMHLYHRNTYPFHLELQTLASNPHLFLIVVYLFYI